MRVVVVGAGLAGLHTAELLSAGGADVIVLEGSHRPGGRVRTVRAAFVGGQYAESGAEWVDTSHARMHELLQRFGVRTLGGGERWTVMRRWLHLDDELLDPALIGERDPGLFEELAAFERIVEDAAAGIDDPARPELHPHAAAVDACSLADVAAEAGLGELAQLFKRRDSQGEFAAEPRQVSLLFVAQQRALQARDAVEGVVRAHRVDGGFSQLAEGVAAELADVVRFGATVVGIEQDADGVLVTTADGNERADHVVLACSLVPVRRMHIEPAMPPALHRAVHELGYGTVTKTAVQWPRRDWPAGYATTAGAIQRVYEPTIDQPGREGVLMSYAGGDGGREWGQLDEAIRIERVAAEMALMHRLDDTPLGGFSRAWSGEARFGGSYAVYEPGQVTAHWRVLREAWGRVHLAGEHVATCTGYMEGALESGETVAARLLGG